MCSELCVKLQASNDIDLLIVYTHNSCGSETCLHGPKGKLEKPDQSPNLHLSGEEIYDSKPQSVQAHQVRHACPPEKRNSIPINKSSPQGIAT